MEHIFNNLNNWPVESQDRFVFHNSEDTRSLEDMYLPSLIKAWQLVEQYSGHRWKCTSYWRDSPTHRKGQAIDIAPDFSPESEHRYAVTNGSDPVLYKRTVMIRQLQKLCNENIPIGLFHVGFFIEPDHLHIQLLSPNGNDGNRYSVYKWKQPKPIYKDTFQRMELPML